MVEGDKRDRKERGRKKAFGRRKRVEEGEGRRGEVGPSYYNVKNEVCSCRRAKKWRGGEREEERKGSRRWGRGGGEVRRVWVTGAAGNETLLEPV